jgi:hypothetical protein
MQIKVAKRQPIKQAPLYGAEGQAVISNNKDGLRQDNVYPELKVISGDEFTEKFGKTRKGWNKAIYSNGTLVNLVGKDYGVLSNIDFFGEIENKLLEKDIRVMTRAINREDRAFAVDHILSDDRYVINVKNGMDSIRPMLSFTTSYDGSTKTQGFWGFFRTVCQNGLHVSQSEIGFSLKHTGNIVNLVMPGIDSLIEKFMDNEFFSLKRKFEILAETPIKDLGEYVKMVCNETGIFQFEKSEENDAASKHAENVINTIRREAKLLNVEPNAWLSYNSFNAYIHSSKKGFQTAYNLDAKLFDFHMELASN